MRLWVLTFLLLTACAPQTMTVGTPVRQATLTSNSVIATDAARLPLRAFEAEDPKAIILGVHGFNDYSRAFEMPGLWFAERGITFYAYDQRGFGEAPAHGKWAGVDVLVNDLRSVASLLSVRHPNVPLYIVGTSMGGAVTLSAAADEGLAVDGLVLAAPAVWGWSNMNLLYRSMLWAAAHTAPQYSLTGEGLGRWPSDNQEMLRRNFHDPLIIKETRIDSIYGLVDMMDEAYLSIEKVRVPVLLLYGERDEIVPRASIDSIKTRFENDLTIKEYPDGWHMLLRDLQREVVWRDIEAWIRQVEAPPSPPY